MRVGLGLRRVSQKRADKGSFADGEGMTRPKVLIADGDKAVARSLAGDLRGNGFTVSAVATSAEQAREAALRDPPDCAVVDLHLPGAPDGTAVAESISGRAPVAMVFTCSRPDPDLLERARHQDPFACLLKPIPPGQLPITLDLALHRNHSRRRLQDSHLALLESELRFQRAFANAAVGLAVIDLQGRYVQANLALCRMLEYTEQEMCSLTCMELTHPREREATYRGVAALVAGKVDHLSRQKRYLAKNGQVKWGSVSTILVSDIHNQPLHLVSIIEDITRRKQAMDEVRRARDRLEIEVAVRTRELEEANTALKVLLMHRDRESLTLKENVTANLQGRVMPYLRKLSTSGLTPDQRALATLIEQNLAQVASPFASRLTSPRYGLTGRELEVASLVRDGKSSKEIAALLNVSERTVKYHRLSLRQKVGISGSKTNLRAWLQRLSSSR